MLTYRRDGEKEVIAMSKKYYAIYDELDTIEEVFVFDTAADRDEWVNFQDEFSVDTNTTADNCIFQRKAVTADELKEIIAYCVKIELLQMSEDGVLSCKYLDESLAVLVEKRQRERDRFLTQKTTLNDSFCNENSVINDVSAAETSRNDVDNGISAAENPQSKVKESKVKLTTFALPRTTRTRKGDVGGWTGNDATTYDDVDSEVADLKTGEIWREQVFMRYKFLNHDGKLLDEYIDRWAQEVKISGKRHQCLGDAKKHFGSWMTIQEGKISKNNNHGTAQQLTAQQRINEGKIRGAQHVAELLAQNDACLRDSVQD